MLLGNPHFPWDGAERFYQAQLTIPGKLDVSGASLLGVPLVLIGHTRGLAWSHTVSAAFRFTPFELTLVPGSPTTYLVDGQPQEMTADEVTVQARTPGGGLEPRTRTLYSTRYGPVFTSLLGMALFPWTPAKAFAAAAGPRRRALGLCLGLRRRRGPARDVRAEPHAVAVAQRLRDELQRLALAEQPRAPVVPRTILTYSQSADARSPFFADQTRMYSRKQWNPVPFCPTDVLAQTVSTTRLGPGGACVARTALGRMSVKRLRRGRRIRVRWSGGGRATVDVLRGKRRIARLRGRGGRATWSGRGGRRDGVYVLRVRKPGDTRRLAERRRGGKLRRLRAFERRARCARVRSLSLGAPTFRGRLTIAYRLAARGRVTLTIRRGDHVVRRIRRRPARSGKVRVTRPRLRRGSYRVTLRTGRTRVSVFALHL